MRRTRTQGTPGRYWVRVAYWLPDRLVYWVLLRVLADVFYEWEDPQAFDGYESVRRWKHRVR